MDRLIEVKVKGNHLSKDNKLAGVQYEANATRLRVTFGEDWDSFAKKVTFWNAVGENPVQRTLTADLLEDITVNPRVYVFPIPGEAMTESGECSFVIDGFVNDVRQRSVQAYLTVEPADRADNAGAPADPTPSQAEQLQAQIDSMMGYMADKATVAKLSADQALESEYAAADSAEAAAKSEQAAYEYADSAQKNADLTVMAGEYAIQARDNAQQAVSAAARADTALSGANLAWNEAKAAASRAEGAAEGVALDAYAAKTSASNASTYASSAERWRDEAAAYASSASASETAARSSATSAQQNANSAAAIVSNAAGYANSASVAQQNAQMYSERAKEAQIAAEKARDEAIAGGGGGGGGGTGYTFYPDVSDEGVISWTNDGGLENPDPVNLTGPRGPKGDKGDTGAGFNVKDYYATLAALQAAVPSPGVGDAYGVGTGEPYDIYIYGATSGWVNNGPLQGAKGDKGDKGDPFTYDDFTSEQLASLKGPRGDTGPQGAQGPAGSAGAAGKDGTSVTHSWSGTTLMVTSASGTSSANLKGEKGDAGSDGAAGKDGTSVSIRSITETAVDGGNNIVTFSDGKTMVIKNGSKGSDGSAGPAGPAGNDGAAGKDGVSVTHSWSGTKLTVTSASGTSSADLKGPKGDTGDTGPAGPAGDAGPAGPAGSDGAAGKDATINGVNALTIATDSNLSATQSGSTLTIGLKSVPSSSSNQLVTLASNNWTQLADGRFKQTVSVAGITASTPVVIVDVNLTGTDIEADAAVLGAWVNAEGKGPGSQNVDQGNGTLTFYSAATPSVNIPLNVGVA